MMWKGIELDCFGMPVNPILKKGRPRMKKGGGGSKTTTSRVIPGQTPNEASSRTDSWAMRRAA